MKLINRLGGSTPHLFACIALAAIVTIGGPIWMPGGHNYSAVTSFVGGALLTLAVASWQINASDRARGEAMRAFWRPLSSDSIIVLSTTDPERNADPGELSPFTPYPDAIAGHEVQSYLQREFGREVRIASAAQFRDLEALPSRNVILIGGPNHNRLTAELMRRVWEGQDHSYFHWSSTVQAETGTQPPVTARDDHLIAVTPIDHGYRETDRVADIRDGDGVVEARGMCFRIRGLLGRGRVALVVAGVDTAYGTLAAAEFALDAESMLSLGTPEETLQVVVTSKPTLTGVEPPESLRTVRGSDRWRRKTEPAGRAPNPAIPTPGDSNL